MDHGREDAARPPRFLKGTASEQPSPEVQVWLEDEFPARRSIPEVDRRSALKMMGGTLAIAGLALTGCRWQPQRKIVPYVGDREGNLPGKRKKFATSFVSNGYAFGILAEQMDGRPLRLDGHPDHPASLGSIDSARQAELLNLYDPDRMKFPAYRGDTSAWPEVLKSLREALRQSPQGEGVAFLTTTVGSPSLAAELQKFLAKYPKAQWVQYEVGNRDTQRAAATLAFGRDLEVSYNFKAADIVVSVDADPTTYGPANVRYQRDLSARRSPVEGTEMSRIYALESHPTPLGVMGDHRVRIKPSEALPILAALAAKVGVPGAPAATVPASVDQKVFEAMASDLLAHRGASVVTVGDHQPAEAHVLAHAINSFLGNFGTTVIATAPVHPAPAFHVKGLQDLTTAMAAGQIGALLILGGNPVYDAPADLKFGDALAKVALSAYMGSHLNETAQASQWQLPESHFLEAWGDGLAFDGTYTVVQPLIEPLYDSISKLELLQSLNGEERNGLKAVQATFTQRAGGTEVWRNFLASGVLKGSATPEQPAVNPAILGALNAPKPSAGLELILLPDPYLGDGRNANNNWLQETPRPLTNLTWDNALLMSYATAKRLGITPVDEKKVPVIGTPYYGKADVVKLTVGGQSIEVPVWVNMGQADDVLVLHLGYGRKDGGSFLTAGDEERGGGFNAYPLRTTQALSVAFGAQVEKTRKEYVLASTQHHNTIDASVADSDRELIRETTWAELKEGKPFGSEFHDHWAEREGKEKYDYGTFGSGKDFSFYEDDFTEKNAPTNYQWAMTIDLATCTGCNACVTACQSENNIPTVGKTEVMRGRELHWIRVDRYYKGNYKHGESTGPVIDRDNPPIYVQPVTCMQCEKAPCEPVCPVAATVHSHEGINQMVYNRCVGTRYCSNNCPYKVRRFNFFHYSKRADEIPVLKMLQNPDVTVRFRGVMEKCTYCVQRINDARVTAKLENREIRDGEVRTACQVACPSQAIVFGDMRRKENAVAKARGDARSYLMLEELNTRPRTSYLSRVTNPHPTLVAAKTGGHEGHGSHSTEKEQA